QLRWAEKGQQQLSEEDKALLDKYLKQNTEALVARRAGQTQLKQAEQMMRSGQWQDADALVKTLKTNKYLSVKDQQQVASLSEQAKQKNGKKGAETTKQDPDSLMADAKKALDQKDYDKAITLAQAAERAGYKTVFPWSETPAKVIAAAD